MTAPGSETAETYRKADLRLRLLLLGDGTDTPGQVRGDQYRQLVTAELRRMRTAFDAAQVEPRAAGLDEELQRLASPRARPEHTWADAIPTLLTPAEAAQALRMSVRSVYRAISEGDIRAVRLAEKKRGALRIPASELRSLLE